MTATQTQTAYLIPAGREHAEGWLDRLGTEMGAEVVETTSTTVMLRVPHAAVADLIDDALYYLGPDSLGQSAWDTFKSACKVVPHLTW